MNDLLHAGTLCPLGSLLLYYLGTDVGRKRVEELCANLGVGGTLDLGCTLVTNVLVEDLFSHVVRQRLQECRVDAGIRDVDRTAVDHNGHTCWRRSFFLAC